MLFCLSSVDCNELPDLLNVGVAAHLPSVVMVTLFHHKPLSSLLVVAIIQPLSHFFGYERVCISEHEKQRHTHLLHQLEIVPFG